MSPTALTLALKYRLSLPLALTVGAAALGAPSAMAQRIDDSQTMEYLRDQGVLYFKRKLYKQSKRMLDAAIRRPKGADDFIVALYRGMSAEKLLLLEEAFAMAERAQVLAEGNAQRRDAAGEFLQMLAESYGPVTFKRASGPSRGRLELASEAKIIIKQKRAMFLSIRERLKSTEVELPVTVYLPFGQYSIRGSKFTVRKGERPVVATTFANTDLEDDGGISPWWYAGAGAAVAAGVGAWLLLQDDGGTTRTDTRFELER